MNIRYKITPIDSIRYQLIVVKDSPEYIKRRTSYYYQRGGWLILWIYALGISIACVQSATAFVVLSGLFVIQIPRLVSFDSHLQRLYLEHYCSAQVKGLNLRVDSAGLTETDGDLVFYAPWSEVQRADIYDDLLLVRVRSGQYIVIPRHALEPGEFTLEFVLNEISSHLRVAPRINETICE